MGKQRLVPIGKRMFQAYALLFLAFFLVADILVVSFVTNDINRSILDTQRQMTDGIAQAVEQYIKEMDDFSMSLMNSNRFKDAVLVELPEARRTGSSQQDAWMTSYMEAHEMFEKGYRVGVATMSGYYIWMADQVLVEPVLNEVDTYADYEGSGKARLYALEQNDYLLSIDMRLPTVYRDNPTIVLARSINRQNIFTRPEAILEVHVDRKDFHRFVRRLVPEDEEALGISIYTDQLQLLYGEDAARLLAVDDGSQQWFKIQNGDLVRVTPIFGDGLILVFRVPESVFMQKIVTFLLSSVGISLVMCGLVMWFTYRLSQSMVRPIGQICRQLESIDLSRNHPQPKVETHIAELDFMSQRVVDLNQKLIENLDNLVTLRAAEVQSRYMALQSQLQPHFLYNTLATIGMLSEEGKGTVVSRMCENLSEMLRYVSAPGETAVPLYEELSFLQRYVDIMAERFPKARVWIDVPYEMMEIQVPKLVLQPLCENAFKYSGRPDTEIWINGSIEAGYWLLRLRDNGPGFAPETIEKIMARGRRLRRETGQIATSIDGLGLANIYARLGLLTHDRFRFEITADGEILVGGVLDDGFGKENQTGTGGG